MSVLHLLDFGSPRLGTGDTRYEVKSMDCVMIRAKIEAASGRQVLVLGLSGENLTRLIAGEPILSDCGDVGFDLDLIVLYARDLKSVQAQVDALIAAVPTQRAPESAPDALR